jgi:inorganic pyrophosphatase
MSDFSDIKPFDEESNDINVIIETPKGSRNKFAYDEKLEVFSLKSVLPAGAAFPFDFGFIPNTRGDDGDPLDVLVLMDEPAFTGCHVPVRLIGAIQAEQSEADGEGQGNGVGDGDGDEQKQPERNDRLIGVASTAKLYQDVRELSDVTEPLVDQIEHFFISYNMERGRKFEPRGRVGARVARTLVESGRKKAKKKKSKKK